MKGQWETLNANFKKETLLRKKYKNELEDLKVKPILNCYFFLDLRRTALSNMLFRCILAFILSYVCSFTSLSHDIMKKKKIILPLYLFYHRTSPITQQGAIRVYARCRPFAKYEIEKKCKLAVDFKDDTSMAVNNVCKCLFYLFSVSSHSLVNRSPLLLLDLLLLPLLLVLLLLLLPLLLLHLLPSFSFISLSPLLVLFFSFSRSPQRLFSPTFTFVLFPHFF
jgi:hypothetical protein